jgi:hypothetical protein
MIRDLVPLLMALLWWRLPAGSTLGNPPNCELELFGTLAETVYCTSRRQMSFDPGSHPVEPKEAVLPATHNRLRRLLPL